MGAPRGRREFLGLAGAAALLTVACTRDPSGEVPGAGPVTLAHAFGETTIPAPPTRVVSAGLTEADDLLAVGVAPVALTSWFGDPPDGVWPWARDALGAATPTVLTLDDGIDVAAIAALKPDLIVAVNAGLDADTYDKLSAVAPTLAQSGADAFFEPWQTQAAAIGRAVFRSEAMTRAVDAAEKRLSAVAQDNPSFAGTTVALLGGGFTGDTVTATVGGWRTGFLTAMGFAVPASLAALGGEGHLAEISRDDLASAVDSADVVIWQTRTEEQKTALLADPAVAALRSTTAERAVFTPTDLAAALAFASPLSYPVVADQLPPLLLRALG